jgi:hypothetical protein
MSNGPKAGASDSATMAANTAAVAAHVHHGDPRPACLVLNQCRIVTPIRKVSDAISQLYWVAKASG